MTTLQTIARALGGEVAGRQVLAPGPGHSAKDRSLCVTLSASAPDGFLVTSFAENDFRECRDYVRARLGLPGFSASKRSDQDNARPTPGHLREESPLHLRAVKSDDAARIKSALEIWNAADDASGSLAEKYFASRNIELPDHASDVVRFHRDCPFGRERFPAVVSLMRNIVSNEPQAIQRTALTPEGKKIDRKMLGPAAGAAIKISDDADVTICLGIGEGLESTKSLCQVEEFGRSPIWALGSAAAIANFPVLAGIESLWIAVDHDPAGMEAAEVCARRWRDAGREVFLIKPKNQKSDLNDLAARCAG